MLQLMEECSGNILAIRATGKLTQKDYEEVFYPRFKTSVRKYNKVRTLFYLDPQFEGWEVEGVFNRFKFIWDCIEAFDKVALVGGEEWIQKGMTFGAQLMQAELKIFNPDELGRSLEWIKE